MHPIVLPTYPHIAAYLKSAYPNGTVAGRRDPLGALLLNMIESQANKTCWKFTKTDHECQVKLYLSLSGQRVSVSRRYLSFRQIGEINNFLSVSIRQQARNLIRNYLMFDRSLTRAVDNAMETLCISECTEYKDALIKDFQRWRKGRSELMIYEKPLVNSSVEMSETKNTATCTPI